jgi:hypothetical protein
MMNIFMNMLHKESLMELISKLSLIQYYGLNMERMVEMVME